MAEFAAQALKMLSCNNREVLAAEALLMLSHQPIVQVLAVSELRVMSIDSIINHDTPSIGDKQPAYISDIMIPSKLREPLWYDSKTRSNGKPSPPVRLHRARARLSVWECIQEVLRVQGGVQVGEIHEATSRICKLNGWSPFAAQSVRVTLMKKKQIEGNLEVIAHKGGAPKYWLFENRK